VALITGGDSGIGRAVALAFAREGTDVLISYLNEDADAEETARVVREAGRKAVLAPGDISEEAHCRSLVGRTISELGRFDTLVNYAAYQMTREGIEAIPDGEWEHTFQTNFFAMYYPGKAAWQHQVGDRHLLQGVGPGGGREGHPRQRRGPRSGLDPAHPRHLAGGEGPAHRPGLPAWATRPAGGTGPLFVFLASDEPSYIAGEVVGVTGGKPLA
jgi:NAD(P)-dependent dehydrogenase (short-subunit alcohol dehydrogenase family)